MYKQNKTKTHFKRFTISYFIVFFFPLFGMMYDCGMEKIAASAYGIIVMFVVVMRVIFPVFHSVHSFFVSAGQTAGKII